jgi:hypothetical protein
MPYTHSLLQRRHFTTEKEINAAKHPLCTVTHFVGDRRGILLPFGPIEFTLLVL